MDNNLKQKLAEHEVEVKKAKESTRRCAEKLHRKIEELTEVLELPQHSENKAEISK